MRWYTVIVKFDDMAPFIDGIRGSSRDEALDNARWNWEGATVSVLDA